MLGAPQMENTSYIADPMTCCVSLHFSTVANESLADFTNALNNREWDDSN